MLEINPRLKIFRKKLWSTVPQSALSEVHHDILHNGKCIGYVLTQIVPDAVIPHIYIKKGFRTKANIKAVKQIFNTEYIPEVRSRGFKHVIATCSTDDMKTQGLIDFLEFRTQTIYYGIIDL